MSNRPEPLNLAAQAVVHSRMHSTSEAAHVILGGTKADAYWGFSFSDFASRFHAGLVDCIGNPRLAPWRAAVDFTPEDYVELAAAVDGMDVVKNPGDHLTHPEALEFVRRSDVYGLHGPIGSGKDTVADALAPHGFQRFSFADPLRVAASMVYGIPMRLFFDRELKDAPLPNSKLSPRRINQLMGTEVVRKIYEDTWARRVTLRMASAKLDLTTITRIAPERISVAGGIKSIVPDIRFENEAQLVRQVGGRIGLLSRPANETGKAADIAKGNGHSSENGISRASSDFQLVNQGTLEQFQGYVLKTMLRPVQAANPEATSQPRQRRRP
jgi:hypothetical protein